jgi:hypothetical protein
MIYLDCMKMCEDFAPDVVSKRTGCCLTTKHRLTLPFAPKATWLSFPTHPSFLFPRLKIKLKGRHFYTIAVIVTESQALLNTLTEHDFQDEFKNWQKCWEPCIPAEGNCFQGDGGRYAQVNFSPVGSTSPGNYGYLPSVQLLLDQMANLLFP